MVEIVKVASGTSSFIDEEASHRPFAKILGAPDTCVLLLTEAGEEVDPRGLLTRGRYFLLRKDQFQLDSVNVAQAVTVKRQTSQVEVLHKQPFEFRRGEGLHPSVRDTESGLFAAMNAAKALYDHCFTLQLLLPDWQSQAANRCKALRAVVLGLQKYYKELKRKEASLGERLDALPTLRENYREQLRRIEPRTPTLAAMLKFLADHDFGKLYKRKHDVAKVKRAAVHGKFARLKEEVKAQEAALTQATSQWSRSMDALTARVAESESNFLITAVGVVEAYNELRQGLESVAAAPRGAQVRAKLPSDLSSLRAAEAEVRQRGAELEALVTQASHTLEAHRSALMKVAHSVAKVTSTLHVKVHAKLPKLEKLIATLDQHTHFLTLPEQAPDICAAFDAERARRDAAHADILSEYQRLETLRQDEERERAEFLKQWGQTVPAGAVQQGFVPLPDLSELQRDLLLFVGEEPQSSPALQELAALVQRKEHLEDVEQVLRAQLKDQEVLVDNYRKSLAQVQRPRVSAAVLAEFRRLAEEQAQFLKGLNIERN